MKKKIIIIAGIACLVLVCAVLIIVNIVLKRIPENPPGTVGNTAGNLYNGGLFCQKDGTVYFANPYDSYSLYSMLPDETGITKLKAMNTSSINADSNYVYYYQHGTGGSSGLGAMFNSTGIIRLSRKNPMDSEILDQALGKYVVLADNYVYYTNTNSGHEVKRVSIDGKEKETLLDINIIPVSIQGSNFYYMNNDKNLHLMALNLSTKTTRQVLADDVYMPIIEGNTVYGIDIHDDYALIRLDITDGSKITLDSSKTDLLNVTDTYIYYQTSGDTPQLKRVRRDGSDMEVVADGVHTNINATSRYVYFTRYGGDTPMYKTSLSGPVNVVTFDAASQAATEQMEKK